MDAIKTQLDEFYDNHIGDNATEEVATTHGELVQALEDEDVDAVEQALSDFVDAAREMGSELGLAANPLDQALDGDISDDVKQEAEQDVDLGGPTAAQLDAESWETELAQLASLGGLEERPELSDGMADTALDLDDDSSHDLAL